MLHDCGEQRRCEVVCQYPQAHRVGHGTKRYRRIDLTLDSGFNGAAVAVGPTAADATEDDPAAEVSPRRRPMFPQGRPRRKPELPYQQTDRISSNRDLLWRGSASDTLSNKSEKNIDNLDKGVEKMFKKCPPEASKK